MCLIIGSKVAVLDDIITGVVIKIEGNKISIKDSAGMVYFFDKVELIKVDDAQDDLLRYSSMDDKFLRQKKQIKKIKKSPFKKIKNDVVLEVDLHVEKLVKSTRGMDNFDMLNLQINTAKNKIEFAISKRISKIIFIHGVGEGVLKKELHFLLNRYPVKYSDGSYKHYGLGATEVYVFQSL